MVINFPVAMGKWVPTGLIFQASFKINIADGTQIIQFNIKVIERSPVRDICQSSFYLKALIFGLVMLNTIDTWVYILDKNPASALLDFQP